MYSRPLSPFFPIGMFDLGRTRVSSPARRTGSSQRIYRSHEVGGAFGGQRACAACRQQRAAGLRQCSRRPRSLRYSGRDFSTNRRASPGGLRRAQPAAPGNSGNSQRSELWLAMGVDHGPRTPGLGHLAGKVSDGYDAGRRTDQSRGARYRRRLHASRFQKFGRHFRGFRSRRPVEPYPQPRLLRHHGRFAGVPVGRRQRAWNSHCRNRRSGHQQRHRRFGSRISGRSADFQGARFLR